MKTMVLLYDTSCIYEIVILNYFLKATGKEMIFVSPEEILSWQRKDTGLRQRIGWIT